MKQLSRARTAPKQVILFLAANPRDTGHVALDREARSIHVELKRSGYRDRFDFVTRWAVAPLDLLRELRELRPTVVHFSGHGTRSAAAVHPAQGREVVVVAAASTGDKPGGLSFHSAAGGTQVVSPEAIARTLAAAGAQVRLVVLNACFTEPIAAALLPHVDCVVGMSGAIHDDAARSFAIGFYGGLAEHESIAAAFAQGKAAIDLEGLPDAERPRLQVRDGLDATQLILAAAVPSVMVEVPCPYPGMRPFAADDASSFHGRDTEIAELIGRLRAGEREIFVIGPSGSGKSSLVTAGLLPRLARGVAGLGPFVVRELRPGEAPAARLGQLLEQPAGEPLVAADRVAGLLAHRGPGASLLLVVDQLEELFTLASADERAQFLGALRALRAERRCAVVFTLRADFFGALMESNLWAERCGQLSRVEVSPLRSEALREAIAAPARTVGVAVEPDLIERLVADAASEPGILPLLQETMVQLWDVRVGHTLTLVDYQALGDGERNGLAVALARRADATLRQFAPAEAAIARRILLRLISFGEGRSDTRRQQPKSQLCVSAADGGVLQQMIDDRLLTTDDDDDRGEPRVDLAHEIMIAAWPTLAGWIGSHRADELRRRKLEAAAADWVQHGRGARGLLDPIELADAQQQTESVHALGYHTDVAAFIAASRAAHNQQRRRRHYLLAGALAVLAGFVLVVTILAIAARAQTNRAEDSEKNSRRLLAQSYEEQGRQLLLHDLPQEAIPYFSAAREYREDDPNVASLRIMFAAARRGLAQFPPHGRPISSVTFSPDGRLFTASPDGDVDAWNAEPGNPVAPWRENIPRSRSTIISDGHRVLITLADGRMQMWNAATQQWGSAAFTPQRRPKMAWFSASERRVLLESTDGSCEIWDLITGAAIRELRPTDAKNPHVIAFSPDGNLVAIKQWPGNLVQVWDANNGTSITPQIPCQGAIVSAAFSSNGRLLVIAGLDYRAWVLNVETHKFVTAFTHQDTVFTAAFSRDDSAVVTASADRTARVWNAVTGEPKTPLLKHATAVERALFSPDGMRVVTISGRTVHVWNVMTGKEMTDPRTHRDVPILAVSAATPAPVDTACQEQTTSAEDTSAEDTSAGVQPHSLQYAVLSPDAYHVLIQDKGGATGVWSVATGRPETAPFESHDVIQGAAFNAKGTRIVTVSPRAVQVWDAATGGKPIETWQPDVPLSAAAFDKDDIHVIAVTAGSAVRSAVLRWRTETKDVVSLPPPLPLQGSTQIALSLDGAHLAAVDAQGVAVWDLAQPNDVVSLAGQRLLPRSLTFCADGIRVVTAVSGNDDRSVRIWDTISRRPVTSPLQHPEPVKTAVFNHDCTLVLTTSQSNSARVWDVATGKPITRPPEHRYLIMSAAFSANNTHVITVTRDAVVHIWDISPDNGSPAQWTEIARSSPFELRNGALQEQTDAAEPTLAR